MSQKVIRREVSPDDRAHSFKLAIINDSTWWCRHYRVTCLSPRDDYGKFVVSIVAPDVDAAVLAIHNRVRRYLPGHGVVIQKVECCDDPVELIVDSRDL